VHNGSTSSWIWLALFWGSCLPNAHRPIPSYGKAESIEVLREFRQHWLTPSRTAPPTVDEVALVSTIGETQVAAKFMLAEAAPWNQWESSCCRLFNERQAWWFEVRISSPHRLTWLPEGTSLVVNDELPISATPSAEVHLEPLLRFALLQESFGLSGDLVGRTRAAGAFRAAHLQRENVDSEGGWLGFSKPDGGLHVTRMELKVTFSDENTGQIMHFQFTFN